MSIWSPETLSDPRTTWHAPSIEKLLRDEHEQGNQYSTVVAVVHISTSNPHIERLYAHLARDRMHWDSTDFRYLVSDERTDLGVGYNRSVTVLTFTRCFGLSAHDVILRDSLPQLHALVISSSSFDDEKVENVSGDEEEDMDQMDMNPLSKSKYLTWFGRDKQWPLHIQVVCVDNCASVPTQLWEVLWTDKHAPENLRCLTWSHMPDEQMPSRVWDDFALPRGLRYLNLLGCNDELTHTVLEFFNESDGVSRLPYLKYLGLSREGSVSESLHWTFLETFLNVIPKLSILELGVSDLSTDGQWMTYLTRLDTSIKLKIKLTMGERMVVVYSPGADNPGDIHTLEESERHLKQVSRVSDIPTFEPPTYNYDDIRKADQETDVMLNTGDVSEDSVPMEEYVKVVKQRNYYRCWLQQLGQDVGEIEPDYVDLMEQMERTDLGSASDSDTGSSEPDSSDVSTREMNALWCIPRSWTCLSRQDLCEFICSEGGISEHASKSTGFRLDEPNGILVDCTAFLSRSSLAERHAVCMDWGLNDNECWVDDRRLSCLYPVNIYEEQEDGASPLSPEQVREAYTHAVQMFVLYMKQSTREQGQQMLRNIDKQLIRYCTDVWTDSELLDESVGRFSGHHYLSGEKRTFKDTHGISIQDGNVIFSAQYVIESKPNHMYDYAGAFVRYVIHVTSVWYLLAQYEEMSEWIGHLNGIRMVNEMINRKEPFDLLVRENEVGRRWLRQTWLPAWKRMLGVLEEDEVEQMEL